MSLAACADLVRRGDPDRWLSLRFQPGPVRARLLPLYAFNLEVARAPWVSSEPGIGQMRLQWWRDVLDEIGSGGPVRRHEVATPLAEVLPPAAVALLDDLVLARHLDLEPAPFADWATLEHYLEDTGAGLLSAAAMVLGADPDAALSAGMRDLGLAGALAAWFRAVPELRARGHRPLPEERPEILRHVAGAGLTRWLDAREEGIDPAARPAALTLWRTPDVLRRAWKDPSRILAGQLDTSPARRHLSLVMRRYGGGW